MRAIGPWPSVPDKLADPMLELFNNGSPRRTAPFFPVPVISPELESVGVAILSATKRRPSAIYASSKPTALSSVC